jgi:hypothetical protein
MYNQYNKNKIQNLGASIKLEVRKHLYIPMFLSLSSIVSYALVHLGGQLESFAQAFLSEDPRVLGVVSLVISACFLLFFLRLMKDKEYDVAHMKDLISYVRGMGCSSYGTIFEDPEP